MDDLIVNTGGAMVGWAIAGPLTRWLPTLDTLDDAALERRRCRWAGGCWRC
ncbi:hypothetical protein [Saccharopolyspora pogona]|uniref:hypothetical protein n=1 Tax=Saccharopolyspora pogona TaxID=333966 RepID=UPI001CC2626B|nr:hypothetical protein [Saccharopolyspora pogona]